MDTLQEILKNKIVAIIRGVEPDDVLKISDALYKGGIRALEITFNSPNAMEVLRELAVRMGDKMLIGMGTVLDAATARTAIESGAKFIISPSLDIGTIQETKRLGAVSMPGALTPTEILTAYKAGADIVKVFPASGNYNYIREVRAPLSHIPLMPTGGVDLDNIRHFKEAGAVAFGIGSSLVNSKEKVTDASLANLIHKAQQFLQAIN